MMHLMPYCYDASCYDASNETYHHNVDWHITCIRISRDMLIYIAYSNLKQIFELRLPAP